MLDTFPELPSVLDKVPEDIERLEALARHAEEGELFGELMEIVEEAKTCLTLGTEIERGAFGPDGHGVAGRLYTAFAKAARGAPGHERADLPWLAIRQLTIELHNEHKETKAAILIIIALLSFQGAQPSAEVDERLREDEATLRSELLWREFAGTCQRSRWNDALERLRQLEQWTADAAERQKIIALRQQLQRRRTGVIGRRIAWGVAAVIVGAIWIGSFDSQPTRPRPPSAPSASTPRIPNFQIAPPEHRRTSSRAGAALVPRPEIPPLVGNDRLLSRDAIRYCLFQGERLEAYRLIASTNPQIDHLNRLISDWNSRCSSYRYYEEDMQAVQRELNAEGARLRREGQDLNSADALPQFRAGPDDARLLSPTTSSADAREVQRRLATLGLYTGAVDGVWGPSSKRALAEYKRGVGLPPNPDWDRTTQDRLFFATGE